MRWPDTFLLYAGRRFWAFAGLVLNLSLVACATPTPPAPTPSPILVKVNDVTAPLLADLAAAYVTATVQASPDAGLWVTSANGVPGDFATPLGYVEFAIVVHPANPLTSLSLSHTHAIFLGDLTDWAQVSPGLGGAIQVVSREAESEAAQALFGRLGENIRPTRNALLAPSWAAMRATISGDANTIGYLPHTELDATVKALSVAADLRLPLVALSAAEPTGPARDFLAWVQSPAGQAVVAQRYLPLVAPE